MTELARLGFDIDPEGNAARGTRDLRGLEQQSVRTEQATDRMGKTSRTAGDAIDHTGRSAEQASSNFRRATVAAGAFATALGGTAAAAQAFNRSLTLDSAIGELSTLLPGATRDLRDMTAVARTFAAEYGTSQADQIRGFYQAVSAGATNATTAIEMMDAANRLAIGGVTEVATAVDILTTATNAYAEQGLTAADAADILFTGVRAGKTTVDELAATLGRAIPPAAALGISLEEVVASVAGLTTQGQDTALAVTGVAGAMSQLLNPSQQARDLAEEIGLEFSAAAVRARGFAGFLDEVVRATGGSQEMMAELFGSIEALRAILALAGGGADSFAGTLEMMETRVGAADQAFENINSRISQQWNRTVAEAAILSEDFGDQLSAVLVPAASEVIAVLTDAEDASLALEVAMKGATVAAGAFAAISGGRVVASMVAASAATGTWSTALQLLTVRGGASIVMTQGLTAATRLLLGPVGLAVTAVGALTAAWVLHEPAVDRLRSRYSDLYDELDRVEDIQDRMVGLNLQRARELLAEAEAAQRAADAEAELAIARQRARVQALQSAADAPSLGGRDSANRQADLRRLAEAQEELNRLEGESFQRRAELAGATEELRAEVQSLLAAERVRDRERRQTSDQTRRLTREERERRDEIAATRAEILQEIEDLTRLEAAMEISAAAHDRVAAEIERENEVRALGIDLTSSLGQEMLEELRVRDQLRDSIDDITEARDKEARAIEEQKREIADAVREMEREIDSASRTATKLTIQGFEDGWGDALDNVANMIAEWALRNLVFEPIIRPIIQGGGLSVSPNGGISIGGVGGLGGIGQGGIGNGFGLFGALNGIGGNIGTSLGSFLGNSAINLGAGANTAQFLANAGLRIGNASPYALLGSVLGNAFGLSGSGNGFVDAGLNLGGAVAGQALGGSLSFLGSAGGPIGAILGSLLGQGLGSLFADQDYPYARGDIRIQNGQAVVSGSETLDGASAAEVRQASQAIADTINAALGQIGASGSFAGGTTFGQASGRSGALGSGFFAGADGGFSTGATWTRLDDPEEAAARAVAYALSSAIAHGAIDLPAMLGDPFEAAMEIFERNAFDLDKAVADINFAQSFEDTLLALEGSVLSFSETVEGQARAQIEAALGPLDDFLSKTAEMGLDSERAGEAVETYVRSLLGLTESESLNAAQANLDIINAQFDALADSVTRFGISAEEVEQGRQIALENARQSFADQINAALLQATGRGYVLEGEQLLAQIAEMEAQAEVYGVAFEEVDELSRALVTNLLADLDPAGIEEVRALFGDRAGEYADLFEAALAGTLEPIENATRTVEDFLSEVERATLELGGRGFILDAREVLAQAEAWRADAEQFGVGMDEVNQFARAALADILRSLDTEEIEALRADMGAQASQYADLFEAALAGLLPAVLDPAAALADFYEALQAEVSRLENSGPAGAIRAIGDDLRAGLAQANSLGADPTLLLRRAFLELARVSESLNPQDFEAVREALGGLPDSLGGAAGAVRAYLAEVEDYIARQEDAARAQALAAQQVQQLQSVYDRLDQISRSDPSGALAGLVRDLEEVEAANSELGIAVDVSAIGFARLSDLLGGLSQSELSALLPQLDALPDAFGNVGSAVRDALAAIAEGSSVVADAQSRLEEAVAAIAAAEADGAALVAAATADADAVRSAIDTARGQAAAIEAAQSATDGFLQAVLAGYADQSRAARVASDERIDQLRSEAQFFARAAEQITAFSRDLVFSNVSPVSLLDQFDRAQSNFDMTLAAARSGDQDALARLTDDAQTLLDLNSQVNRSGVAGNDVFGRVQAALDEVGSRTGSRANSAEASAAAIARANEQQNQHLEDQIVLAREMLGIQDDGFGSVRDALADVARTNVEAGVTLEAFLADNAAALDLLAEQGFEDPASAVAELFAQALADRAQVEQEEAAIAAALEAIEAARTQSAALIEEARADADAARAALDAASQDFAELSASALAEALADIAPDVDLSGISDAIADAAQRAAAEFDEAAPEIRSRIEELLAALGEGAGGIGGVADAVEGISAEIASKGPLIMDRIDEVAIAIGTGGNGLVAEMGSLSDHVAQSALAYSDYVGAALAEADRRLQQTVAANDRSNEKLQVQVSELIQQIDLLRRENREDAEVANRLGIRQVDELSDLNANNRSTQYLTSVGPNGRLVA